MNCLDFQKALDKFAKLLRKLLRQEPWEERPGSVWCLQMSREDGAGGEARATAWPKDALLRPGLEA